MNHLYYVNNLVPGGVVHNKVVSTPTYYYPLTPFFFKAGSSHSSRGYQFSLSGFFGQYKSTRHFGEPLPTYPYTVSLTDEPICGSSVYQIRASSWDSSAGKSAGSITRDYVFDEDDEEIVLKSIETGDNIVGLTHSRTSTTAKSGGGQYDDPPTNDEVLLSNPLNRNYLKGKRSLWVDQSEEYKNTTGIASVINTESGNIHCKVGVGDARAKSSLMYPRDFAGQWDNHFVYVKTTERKNSPTIYQEVSDNHLFSGKVASGLSCYRDGYAEEVFSGLVTKPWRDDYGVWSDPEILDAAPQIKEYSGAVSYLPVGEGKGHEATYISKTGKKIRATFQLGSWEFGGNYQDPSTFTTTFNVVQSVTKTTDNTLQFNVVFDEHENIRLYKIEVYNEAAEEWDEVANADDGIDPHTLVVENACEEGYLLCFVKRREGSKWGYTERKPPYATRYKKKHFKKHLTVGLMDLDSGSCGGGVSGKFDLDIVTEYNPETGLLKEPIVNQWSAAIDGKDWTPEDPFDYDSISIYGGSTDLDTATTLRKTSDHTWAGRYFVALDTPNRLGKIEHEADSKLVVSVEDDQVWSSTLELNFPSSGSSTFYESHRLSPE